VKGAAGRTRGCQWIEYPFLGYNQPAGRMSRSVCGWPTIAWDNTGPGKEGITNIGKAGLV
jgi:hypothetical protein